MLVLINFIIIIIIIIITLRDNCYFVGVLVIRLRWYG